MVEAGSTEQFMASKLEDGNWRRSTLIKLFIPVALAALVLRVVYGWSVVVPDRLIDDGYITLRYAANLAQGQGFVYNQGEPVWGTTTPLFTLLLAGAATTFGVSSLETSALVLDILASAFFWLTLCVVFEQQRLPRVVSIPVLFVVMFSPAFLGNSLSGMETPVVLLLMALSLYAYTNDRPLLLGLFFALLLMARIDTLIWIGVLGVAYILWQARRNPRSVLLGVGCFIVLSLPWQIYAYRTFHSLIPQSVVGKAVSHGAFEGVSWAYFEKYYQIYFPVGRLGRYAPVGIVASLALVLWGLWTVWKQFPLLRPLGVFFVCFTTAFYLAKAPEFQWYFPPAQWVGYFLLCMGLYSIWNQGLALGRNRVVQILPCSILMAGLIFQSAIGARDFWRDRSKPNHFVALSEYLVENSSPSSTIFVEHIGTVGFHVPRTIIDNMGLVSPEIAELKKANGDRWVPVSLTTLKPDVVVLYPIQDPKHTVDQWRDEDRAWLKRVTQLENVHRIDKPVWTEEDRAWFDREYRFARQFDTDPTTYVYFRAPAGKPPS
jgi:hypothetical protein